jgi:agmatine deiminase
VLADHQANCVYLAGRLRRQLPGLWRTLEQVLLENGVPLFRLDGTKDLWLRDFLPVQVGPGRFVKFRYEPDYLPNGYQHLITGEDICRSIPHPHGCRRSDINLDGGNVTQLEIQLALRDGQRRAPPVPADLGGVERVPPPAGLVVDRPQVR